jgi:hypothetical protein
MIGILHRKRKHQEQRRLEIAILRHNPADPASTPRLQASTSRKPKA